MDAYSYNPGPTKEQAMNEIKNYFDSDHGYMEFVRRTNKNVCDTKVMNECIKKVVNEKGAKEGAFGSLTGWVVFFRNDLIDAIIKEYMVSTQPCLQEP